MQIQYVLTKDNYNDLNDANHTLNKVKSILQESKHYDHNETIPMMILKLIERERQLTSKLKETEQ